MKLTNEQQQLLIKKLGEFGKNRQSQIICQICQNFKWSIIEAARFLNENL
jgi:hypothetical protein